MTVGIAAMAEKETRDSNVVVAADRMVTAMRESPIEYEHPSTKLTRIEHTASDVQVLTVAAGSVSLADELVHKIESSLRQREDSSGVREVADLAAKCYNDIIRETINSQLLVPLGLEFEDLRKQRKFQEDFVKSLMSDVQEYRNTINRNLNVLLAGIGPNGAQLYEIMAGDVTAHNSIGYATVGSGENPAASEFVRTKYSVDCSLDEAVSTVVAAKMRAEDAQGVGEGLDIGIASLNEISIAGDGTKEELRSRQKEIRSKQRKIKEDVLATRRVDWVTNR